MKDGKKEELFSFVERLKITTIQDFTRFALENVPEYFWTLPSTTMRGPGHAHDELLVDHVITCAKIADSVANQQFDKYWAQIQKDQLLSAILLHDGWRCGYLGKEERITQEDVKRRGGCEDLIGNLKTSKHHPEVGYKALFGLVCKYNNQKSIRYKICRDEYLNILLGVRHHYGPWTADDVGVKGSPILGERFDSVVAQVHTIDYHQSRNSALQYRKDHE